METDRRVASAIALERTGAQRPDESDADYAERVEAATPRAYRLEPTEDRDAQDRERRATNRY